MATRNTHDGEKLVQATTHVTHRRRQYGAGMQFWATPEEVKQLNADSEQVVPAPPTSAVRTAGTRAASTPVTAKVPSATPSAASAKRSTAVAANRTSGEPRTTTSAPPVPAGAPSTQG
jgi:hypothetical protein